MSGRASPGAAAGSAKAEATRRVGTRVCYRCSPTTDWIPPRSPKRVLGAFPAEKRATGFNRVRARGFSSGSSLRAWSAVKTAVEVREASAFWVLPRSRPEVSRGKSRAIAVLEANPLHAGLGRSPRQTRPRTLCAHFAASVRASPHDRRPDPLLEMQTSQRWKRRIIRARFPAVKCAPNTHGPGADVRARARH